MAALGAIAAMVGGAAARRIGDQPNWEEKQREKQRTNFEVGGKLKKGGHHRRIDVDGRTKVAGATLASNWSKRNLTRGANSRKKRTKNEGSRTPALCRRVGQTTSLSRGKGCKIGTSMAAAQMNNVGGVVKLRKGRT